MIIEWGLLANMIGVLTPLVLVLITYTKTWSKFDLLIDNLTKNVNCLQESVEKISIIQEETTHRLIRLETQLENILERLHNLENLSQKNGVIM